MKKASALRGGAMRGEVKGNGECAAWRGGGKRIGTKMQRNGKRRWNKRCRRCERNED